MCAFLIQTKNKCSFVFIILNILKYHTLNVENNLVTHKQKKN